jgi:SAM-dependent methyltransferase
MLRFLLYRSWKDNRFHFKGLGETMTEKKATAERKKSEAECHDEYYGSREIPDEDLVVQTEGFREFLAQQPLGDLYACILDRLGDYQGKDLLEYGSGTGQIGVFYALTGAKVRGFDVSEEGVKCANRRAVINGVSSSAVFEPMNAKALSYEDGQFDFVVGRWILHHLEKDALPVYGRELWRVLKDGGKALFIEPLGHNPLIEFVREHPFYAQGDYDSEHESTMKRVEILTMGKPFRSVLIHEFHLLYMLKRVIRNRWILRILKSIDDLLLRYFPFLKRFCGDCVIEFVK